MIGEDEHVNLVLQVLEVICQFESIKLTDKKSFGLYVEAINDVCRKQEQLDKRLQLKALASYRTLDAVQQKLDLGNFHRGQSLHAWRHCAETPPSGRTSVSSCSQPFENARRSYEFEQSKQSASCPHLPTPPSHSPFMRPLPLQTGRKVSLRRRQRQPAQPSTAGLAEHAPLASFPSSPFIYVHPLHIPFLLLIFLLIVLHDSASTPCLQRIQKFSTVAAGAVSTDKPLTPSTRVLSAVKRSTKFESLRASTPGMLKSGTRRAKSPPLISHLVLFKVLLLSPPPRLPLVLALLSIFFR